MNITDWERVAKWFKLQMSVLTPSMEIAQPMPGSLALFPNFNKNVTGKGWMRPRRINALKDIERGKLRFIIRTSTVIFIIVVILLFQRIGDCARSAMRRRYGDEYYRLGKSCEMVQIADECVDSINGNCATDAGFSRTLSYLRRMCDNARP